MDPLTFDEMAGGMPFDMCEFDSTLGLDWPIPNDLHLTPPFHENIHSSPTEEGTGEPAQSSSGIEKQNSGRPAGCASSELLGFSPVIGSCRPLCNSFNETVTCKVSAQVAGMLFVSQDASRYESNDCTQTSSLTCYRRNMLKVFGHAYVPRGVRLQSDEGKPAAPIGSVSAHLSASETLAGDDVKLVVPPARKSTGVGIDDPHEPQPESIKLDPEANPDRYSDPCPFRISWDRLHFRNATTKSNRRSAPQQRFRLVLEIKGNAGGEEIMLCKAVSVPIDVRGRSPKSYGSHTDVRSNAKRQRREEVVQPYDTKAGECETTDIISNMPTRVARSNSPSSKIGAFSFNDDWVTGVLDVEDKLSTPDQLRQAVGNPFGFRVNSEPGETFEGAMAMLTERGSDNCRDLLSRPSPKFMTEDCSTTDDRASSVEGSGTTPPLKKLEHSYEYFPLSALDWTTPAEAVYVWIRKLLSWRGCC